MGKQIPGTLIRQIEEDKKKEIQEDHFNIFPQHVQQIPNKYSPQYAAHIKNKPRAQPSAKIGLGGII